MFLGVDLGTSGVKAVIVDQDGTVTAQATSALTVQTPQPLHSEQDPAAWWHATCDAVQQLPEDQRRAVQSVGLSGQMHGATVLDEQDQPLRPAILWNDGRSQAQCGALEARVHDSRAITGNIAMPGFTAPKLVWLQEHEPELFARIRSVLLPKDYLRLLMTGDKASDMSDSAGTLWLDVGARQWSDAMISASGLTPAHMPELFEGSQPTGHLLPEIAAQWGMDSVPVAAGAGDNAAGAVGVGVLRDGDAFLSLGTSGVTFVATDGFRPNPASAVHAFCHALPETWHQMSVHLSAASCVDWAVRQLGLSDVASFFALAETATHGAEIFLPFLSGERTPHNDPHLRAGWFGCGSQTTPANLALAVLEGVAFAHADGCDALREAGTRVERLSMIGGGSRSQFWGRIIASALNADLDYVDGGTVGPALGAAHLARMALTGEAADTVSRPPRTDTTISPDPQLAEALSAKRAVYQNTIRAIQTQ